FRKRHILVVNAPVEAVDFDREGLETLGSLHSPRTIQGLKDYLRCHGDLQLIFSFSVAELRASRTTTEHCPGTLEQLRLAVQDEHRRVLNMLDLPMGHLGQEPPPPYQYVLLAGLPHLFSILLQKLSLTRSCVEGDPWTSRVPDGGCTPGKIGLGHCGDGGDNILAPPG